MTMDYVGNNGLRFNLMWRSHALIGTLLAQRLPGGVEELLSDGWSLTNDGAPIDDRTCRRWASRLRASVMDGGIGQARNAVDTLGRRVSPYHAHRDAMQARYPEMTEPPARDLAELTLEFAEFLDACGGCRQL